MDVLPAGIDLAGTEVQLLTRTGREFVLARALAPLLESYDIVLSIARLRWGSSPSTG